MLLGRLPGVRIMQTKAHKIIQYTACFLSDVRHAVLLSRRPVGVRKWQVSIRVTRGFK